MKTPAQIRYSTQVTAFCIVALFVMGLAHCAKAQTVEHRKTPPGKIIYWNQADYFKTAPKLKFWDWDGYGETWDGKQLVSWGLLAIAGAAFGTREAYHRNPYCFEEIYGVSNTSFWGSDAWKRNYQDNNPDLPHKKEYFGNVGRDVWHTAGAASKVLLVSGTFTIGARNQPKKFRALNMFLGFGLQIATTSLFYNAFKG